jgi:hypothetical protein
LISERDVDDNERQFPLIGSVDGIAATLRAYRAAGLDHIALAPRGLNTLKEYKYLFGPIAGRRDAARPREIVGGAAQGRVTMQKRGAAMAGPTNGGIPISAGMFPGADGGPGEPKDAIGTL